MEVKRKTEKMTFWRPWREASAWKNEKPMKRADATPRISLL
jgi:hypothetical protein